jgi:hypothetical protein
MGRFDLIEVTAWVGLTAFLFVKGTLQLVKKAKKI